MSHGGHDVPQQKEHYGLMTMPNAQTYIAEVLDAHFDDAVFLYTEFAAETSSLAESDSAYLERVIARLKANLTGLALNEKVAWTYCDNAFESDDAGEFFVATYLAFLSGDLEKIRPLADAAETSSYLLTAAADALAWHPWSLSGFWASKFVSAKKITLAALGMHCHMHHHKTAPVSLALLLQRALDENNLSATRLLLDMAIQHTDMSVLPVLQAFNTQELNAITFHVLSARIRLGDLKASGGLKPFVMVENEHREVALNLSLPLLEKTEAKQWIAELRATQDSARWVLLGVGALKEQMLLPWVLTQMETVELARIAGKVFEQLTGIDLKEKQWLLSDESIDQAWLELEGDEELDWPDHAKIKQAMHSIRG